MQARGTQAAISTFFLLPGDGVSAKAGAFNSCWKLSVSRPLGGAQPSMTYPLGCTLPARSKERSSTFLSFSPPELLRKVGK